MKNVAVSIPASHIRKLKSAQRNTKPSTKSIDLAHTDGVTEFALKDGRNSLIGSGKIDGTTQATLKYHKRPDRKERRAATDEATESE